MTTWKTSKEAKELVESGRYVYTGRWELRTERQLGMYGYGLTELYYELKRV